MMKKIIAWAVLAFVVWGSISLARAWKNPFATVSAPTIIKMLPPAGEGCKDSKGCFHD